VASSSSSSDEAAGESFPILGSAITSSATSICPVTLLTSSRATAFASGWGLPSTLLYSAAKGISTNGSASAGVASSSSSSDEAAGESFPILGSAITSSATSICPVTLSSSVDAAASEFFPILGSAITSSAASCCSVSLLTPPPTTAFTSGGGVPSPFLSPSVKDSSITGSSSSGIALPSLSFNAAAGESFPVLGSISPSSAFSNC